MGTNDVIWMAMILGGVAWLLYRSLWKKRGQCHGCSGGCGTAKSFKTGHCQ